jgi:hypothetical protein
MWGHKVGHPEKVCYQITTVIDHGPITHLPRGTIIEPPFGTKPPTVKATKVEEQPKSG